MHHDTNAFEALEFATDPARPAKAQNPKPKVRANAIDTGVEDADLNSTEEEVEEEDLDVDDEDDIDETDERRIDKNGFRKIR